MKKLPLPPLDYVREALEYSELSATGLVWKKRPRTHFPTYPCYRRVNGRLAGRVAGCANGGKSGGPRGGTIHLSWSVAINRTQFLAHRIVWLLCHDLDPGEFEVDHIDGDARNNLIDNLRLATRAQNAQNLGPGSQNKSGVHGVHFHKRKGKWEAQIIANRKRIHIGLFAELEDAAKARRQAEKKFHGEFIRK